MRKFSAKIICVLLIAALAFGLCACGEDDGITGKYICIGESWFGEEFSEPSSESYIQLKKDGSGKYNTGLGLKLKWELNGEDFEGTYSVLGFECKLDGFLKDGVLEVSDSGTVRRYLREGAELPSWAEANVPLIKTDVTDDPDDTDDTTEDARLMGFYAVKSVDMDGSVIEGDDLIEAELSSTFLRIDYDNTGEFGFENEEPDSFVLDEEAGTLTFDDGTVASFYEEGEGVIKIVFVDDNGSTMTIYFELKTEAVG